MQHQMIHVCSPLAQLRMLPSSTARDDSASVYPTTTGVSSLARETPRLILSRHAFDALSFSSTRSDTYRSHKRQGLLYRFKCHPYDYSNNAWRYYVAAMDSSAECMQTDEQGKGRNEEAKWTFLEHIFGIHSIGANAGNLASRGNQPPFTYFFSTRVKREIVDKKMRCTTARETAGIILHAAMQVCTHFSLKPWANSWHCMNE
ncbi:hypothetical protein V8C44DRAFT_238889 [Trichoderma aethiopicum]